MIPLGQGPLGFPVGTGHAQATATVSITVTASPLSIVTATIPNGVVGTAYSQTFVSTGGTPTFAWTNTGPSLPAGLTLTAAGLLSGTPTTAAATITLQITVTDSSSPALSFVRAIPISIEASVPVSITTPTLPNGTALTPYTQTLTASGGTVPYAWDVIAGAIPAGLTLNGATGVLSGTPTLPGGALYAFTARVLDAYQHSSTVPYSITIALPTVLQIITTSPLPPAVVGVPYSFAMYAVGGTPPYVWSVSSGALPAGLTINSATGVISGTPTSSIVDNFTIAVTDSA
ncbi:MAG: hypothetical protein NVS9B4_01060 [Candidatus Acidiferrum sp.]